MIAVERKYVLLRGDVQKHDFTARVCCKMSAVYFGASDVRLNVALASPAVGHWGRCPLDFQQFFYDLLCSKV